VSVASQYWQDSNQAFGSGASFIPAKIPAYTVLDLAGDVNLGRNLRLLGGVSNLADRSYYSRVFQTGLEPSPRRTVYAGLALGF
jgi:Fe(3+) dicitrate transport protein